MLTEADAVRRKSMAAKSGTKKSLAPAALRHKWLRMDEEGDTAEVALGKHALTHRLGVQARANCAYSPVSPCPRLQLP